MSDLGDSPFDLDVLSLIASVEQAWDSVKEMSSSIDAVSEAALSVEAERVESPCCSFAGRVTTANRQGLADLVDLALSVEFRKYTASFFKCL